MYPSSHSIPRPTLFRPLPLSSLFVQSFCHFRLARPLLPHVLYAMAAPNAPSQGAIQAARVLTAIRWRELEGDRKLWGTMQGEGAWAATAGLDAVWADATADVLPLSVSEWLATAWIDDTGDRSIFRGKVGGVNCDLQLGDYLRRCMGFDFNGAINHSELREFVVPPASSFLARRPPASPWPYPDVSTLNKIFFESPHFQSKSACSRDNAFLYLTSPSGLAFCSSM